MKKKFLLMASISLLAAIFLSACATNDEPTPNGNSNSMEEKDNDSNMNQDMEGHMDHDEEPNLTDSTGENELKIPAALGNESDNESEVAYTVRAHKGETEIFDGAKTKTYRYNGDFLGPVLRFRKGDKVKINT